MNRGYYEIAHDLVVNRLESKGTMFKDEHDIDDATFEQYINLVERWGEE